MSQSAADSQSQEIDEHTYTVSMLDPFVANKILVMLGKILGPSLGSLTDVVSDDTDAQALNNAAGGLFERLDESQLRWLIDELSKVTSVRSPTTKDQEPQLNRVFQIHFRGRISSMYKWLWFALKVQFADFFALVAPAIARAAALAAKSNSPDTSLIDGLSIDSSSPK